jgi:hypothetical protein
MIRIGTAADDDDDDKRGDARSTVRVVFGRKGRPALRSFACPFESFAPA